MKVIACDGIDLEPRDPSPAADWSEREPMSLLRVVWSIFWRLMVVLILNAGINYGIAHISYWLTPQSPLSVMIRGSIAFLPAAIILSLLAGLAGREVFLLFERRSRLDSAQWRQTYFLLAASCLVLVSVVGLVAVSSDVDTWLSVRQLAPFPFLLLVCFGISIFQSQKLRGAS